MCRLQTIGCQLQLSKFGICATIRAAVVARAPVARKQKKLVARKQKNPGHKGPSYQRLFCVKEDRRCRWILQPRLAEHSWDWS
jgi:hypothetical protein